MHIIENEIYKGDFIHGKRTKNPTYYENVVEPIISKELWEECQHQKRNNSRAYSSNSFPIPLPLKFPATHKQ